MDQCINKWNTEQGSNGENQQNLNFVLWNINKIDKPSAWLRKIDDQILKSGVKYEAWLLALQKQKRHYKGYYEQLYAKKLDYLEEMEKLWGRHKLLNLIQEEMKNPSCLNNNNKETEFVNKNFP